MRFEPWLPCVLDSWWITTLCQLISDASEVHKIKDFFSKSKGGVRTIRIFSKDFVCH